MFKFVKASVPAIVVATLCACGGSSSQTGSASTSTAHGTLALNPPFRIASRECRDTRRPARGHRLRPQLLELTGAPKCGVDFYYVTFWTLGGAGETTESSGALMVPTGAAPACSGPRPIVEYAHGTNANKALNIADITNTSNTEGALIAAMFAAQGYIVVAPNYAGYDISTLGYHPFLNAAQQSGEMMDILAAARTALPNTLASATSDNGKSVPHRLFGGRSRRHGDAARDAGGGQESDCRRADVRPLCPRSPRRRHLLRRRQSRIDRVLPAPGQQLSARLRQHRQHHAPALFLDLSERGDACCRATRRSRRFSRRVSCRRRRCSTAPPRSYRRGSAELTALLAVPPTPALPASPQTPIFDLGFGNPFLINNDVRVAYAEDALASPDGAVPTPTVGVPRAKVEPTFGLRRDFWVNDMRTAWAPESPTLLCGGDLDPTVFFSIDTEPWPRTGAHCLRVSSRCST